MKNSNIQPFYIGQKVVYITGLSMPKNSIHTVLGLMQDTCGCWSIDIGRKTSFKYGYCQDHNSYPIPINGIDYCCASSFVPLQESKFKAVSFEKIMEEVEQLCEN